MDETASRREFIKTATTGSTLFLAALAGASCRDHVKPPGNGAPGLRQELTTREEIESEIRRRAAELVAMRYLVVDYYRIHRRLAYALPVASLSIPSLPVPTIRNYPWATWMTWALEERVNTLGWAVEWFQDSKALEVVSRDLEALADWPKFRQYEQPDLSSAHAGRILWTAVTKWQWVDEPLRERLRAGCMNHVNEVLPESDRAHGQLRSKEEILRLDEPHRKLHNIPLIGTIGAALTASAAAHPAFSVLNERIHAIFEAILELRNQGYTEGVSYDGYILDFIADWLHTLGPEKRSSILEHVNLNQFLEESYMLSAPGAAEEVAPLSDVEPREMPFHFSAQAKLHDLKPDAVRAWHLRRWRIDWIRAAGLGSLHAVIDSLEPKTPEAGALNAHYAAVLRTGWAAEDLAVVASCSSSPPGHIQRDNGTLVLGTRGHWIITDPGYQQYMRDQEREFTLGPNAHNYPVINNFTQDKKRPRLEKLERLNETLFTAVIDLSACYPEEAQIGSIVRSIWLSGSNLVLVADQMTGKETRSVSYHWHANPEASWWCQDNWILLNLSEVALWLTSPQAKISFENIQRLPGSKGQLTLVTETDHKAPVIWWLFHTADRPTSVEMSEGGTAIHVLDQRFSVRASEN